jgi:alpha-beta hydrolase superfamily lysophospholipase
MRSTARLLAAEGFVVVVPRLPGHGTTPEGLDRAEWQDWRAVVRAAARHAASRAPGRPLVMVGYSNGGALAVDYALDALADPRLPRPRRLLLLSPMIGVPAVTRLAPWVRRLGAVPWFERSRWIDVWPEYVPYKYGSFPAHAAEQSLRLSTRVRSRLAEAAEEGAAAGLPPTLVFQSLVDSTVSTAAVVDGLLERLGPAHELVLFDVNRLADARPFLPVEAERLRERVLASASRRWRLTLVTNRDERTLAMAARTYAPGEPVRERALALAWPEGTFSLSHVALPFPPDDPLWGTAPGRDGEPVPHLGLLEPRGEKGVLVVPVETLMRLGHNPFHPYLAERLRGWARDAAAPVPVDPAAGK